VPADFLPLRKADFELLEAVIEGEQMSHTMAQRRERVDHCVACDVVRQDGEHDVRGQGRAVHLIQEAHAADPGAWTRQWNGIIAHKVVVVNGTRQRNGMMIAHKAVAASGREAQRFK